MVPETLFLTVNLIDRYLEREHIMRPRLQLVGAAALFIASKYEDYQPPPITDFQFICENAYTRDEILDMEYSILHTL